MTQLIRLLDGKDPLIMGILNVTPDSFSDGGWYSDLSAALSRVHAMRDEGADIIDVGGESTRPGAVCVDEDIQLARIIPVIEGLRSQFQHASSSFPLISIDTTRARVAEHAINAGAALVNDVSAGADDPQMFSLVARLGVPIVLMHRRGSSMTMQDNPTYHNVVQEVYDFLSERAKSAMAAGVSKENILVDPGIGFGKTRDHNLKLLAHLNRFVKDLGYPVLLGASRKRFMGALCDEADPGELLGATISTTSLGVLSGVKVFRVHDVKANRQAAIVTRAVMEA